MLPLLLIGLGSPPPAPAVGPTQFASTATPLGVDASRSTATALGPDPARSTSEPA